MAEARDGWYHVDIESGSAPNTWGRLAEAHMVLGHDDDAIRFFERSLELNPNNQDAKTMVFRIRERATRRN